MKKFLKREKVSWLIRKNRIAGLLKNYSALSLIKTLPVLLFIHLFLFLKESFIERDIRLALSSVFAISWNIQKLPYILKERLSIQHKIRKVPDREIVRFMRDKALAFLII